MNANKSTFPQVQTFITKREVRAVNWWKVLSTKLLGSPVFVRFIQNAAADAAAIFVSSVVSSTVTELPVHQIYARTNSDRSYQILWFHNLSFCKHLYSYSSSSIRPALKWNLITHLYMQLSYWCKYCSMLYCSFLRWTDRGVLRGTVSLIYIQIPFHKYESLFNILIYIIKFVVAIQYAYELNVFAKMNLKTGENCDYKAIQDSVSCRPWDRAQLFHPNYFDLKSQGTYQYVTLPH